MENSYVFVYRQEEYMNEVHNEMLQVLNSCEKSNDAEISTIEKRKSLFQEF